MTARTAVHVRPTTPAPVARQDGAVGGVEVLPFSVLVFVVGTLLVASAWGAVDAHLAAADAARQAGRTYAESGGGRGGLLAARHAADDVLQGLGRGLGRARVDVVADGSFGRCRRVRARVRIRVRAVALPFGLGVGDRDVSAEHTELVDPFRAGLPGEARCDA
jgi:hypothetical protein